MAFANLREYLAALDARGELLRVDAPLSPELEIPALADKLVKRGGPAALVTRPRGSDIPVAVNLFGTAARTAFALGVRRLEELTAKVDGLVGMRPPASLADLLALARTAAPVRHAFPRRVRNPPCQEIVIDEGPMLSRLPVLKCWPGDGGRFVTLPLVFTRDPETGARNCGMYRMQIHSDRETGMHWHRHKDGNRHFGKSRGPLPVAVALCGDPAVVYAATAPLPPDIDEMMLAGFLRGAGVPMARATTIDVEVPAESEIVLEGTVDPAERRLEGPFGDHTGFYSLADDYPVFRVHRMTMRRGAIYPATIVGPPPMEDCYLGKASERLFLPFLRRIIPEIVDIDFPIEGIFHNFLVVSIRKAYPGQARKVMHAIWGLGQLMFSKCILVVDAEVDVHRPREVFWHALNQVDPARDLERVDGPLDALDHSSARPGYGGKLGVDATRKSPEEGHTRPWPDRLVQDGAAEARAEAALREAARGARP